MGVNQAGGGSHAELATRWLRVKFRPCGARELLLLPVQSDSGQLESKSTKQKYFRAYVQECQPRLVLAFFSIVQKVLSRKLEHVLRSANTY